MVKFIKEMGLYKDQIISISAHETSVDDADTELVLFYKKSYDPSSPRLDNLHFECLREIIPWDKLD